MNTGRCEKRDFANGPFNSDTINEERESVFACHLETDEAPSDVSACLLLHLLFLFVSTMSSCCVVTLCEYQLNRPREACIIYIVTFNAHNKVPLL